MEELKKNNDSWWFSDKFQNNLQEKYCINFKENSWDFWNQLVEVLKVFWNFGKITRRNLREIWEENFKWFQENYGNPIEKNWSN